MPTKVKIIYNYLTGKNIVFFWEMYYNRGHKEVKTMYGMYYGYGFLNEYTLLSYACIIVALIITLSAQISVKSSYRKYSKIANSRGITGAAAARYILDKHGLRDVPVMMSQGTLSDHYDPTQRVVKLSPDIYNSPSIAAVAVASHECGHAIQHQEGYWFMQLRSLLVPITNICSYLGYFAILIGCITSMYGLIEIGILAECVILLFQVVTLPVELNASRRAMQEIQESNMLLEQEYSQGRSMLTAAAMTYVASVAATLLQILRLVLIFGRKRN